MKCVLICEGQDDLWFLCYYLHKKLGWEMITQKDKSQWTTYRIPEGKGRKVVYMKSRLFDKTVAIVSSNGQDGIHSVIDDVMEINNRFPDDYIHNLIIFRDCDDHNQEEVASSMNAYFSNNVSLHNRRITEVKYTVDEVDIKIKVLPVVIPFDEQGAVETLLMKGISDNNTAGKYIVEHANQYIDDAVEHVKPYYLNKQREQTKAKYSAALAITNPTKSRDNFEELMMSTNWEDSSSIDAHMKEIRELLQ